MRTVMISPSSGISQNTIYVVGVIALIFCFIVGFLTEVFITNQLLITVFFSFPFTKRLKKSNYVVDNAIYRRFFTTIIISSLITITVTAVIYYVLNTSFSGYVIGMVVGILMSLGKIGTNNENKADFLRVYGTYITETNEVISEDIKITYCKKCGGQINNTTRKCMSCGKQYIRPNRVIITILSLLVGILLICVLLQRMQLQEYGNKLQIYEKAEESIVKMYEGRVNPETGDTIDSVEEYIEALEAQSRVQQEYEEFYEDESIEAINENSTQHPYVIIKSTGKFHSADCSDISEINDIHKEYSYLSYKELINQGYEPHECLTEYVGNSKGLIFHHANCNSIKGLADEYRVHGMSKQQLIDAGYKPCPYCKP